MKKILYSLFLIAVALPAFISCEKENEIIVDSGSDSGSDSIPNPDSCLIWHIDDVEFLDSIVEYNPNGLIRKTVWMYDEYGRILEVNNNSASGLSSSKTVWSYSEGGKKITVIDSVMENDKWVERSKAERTVVAQNDTCTNYYRKESHLWVLTGQGECKYDDGGRPVMASSRIAGRDIGLKTEYAYDSNGRCIQEKRYAGWDNDWDMESQMDCSFDEKGNCIYIKSQRYNINTGAMIGDSIMERSFDDKNRETAYSLMRWDSYEALWIGIQKYSLAYDEKGNVVENVIYAWDSASKDWQPKDKASKSYDSEGRLISDANYIWLDGNWVGLGLKYEKSYDSNGNLLVDASYAWDQKENSWSLRSSITKDFDPDGNVSHSISYDGTYYEELTWEDGYKIREHRRYKYSTGQLSSATRWLEYVDENGNDTLIVEYHWLSEEWQEFERTRYTYDDRGNQNSSSVYQLQNGKWVMVNGFKYEVDREGNTETRQKYEWNLYYQSWNETSCKEILTYDESGRLKIILTQIKVWDDATETHWENEEKTEYSYDSYGNNIGFVVSDWYENEWLYRDKEEYAFDAAGNQISEVQYSFDAANDSWIGLLKWTAEFDDAGNQTLLMNYKWGYQNDWEPSAKTISLYDEDGNLYDRARYLMTYRNGAWEWQGDKRTIYTFDPDTQIHLEYNLTFNFITQSWEGKRTERETDEQGNLVREIVYKWIDEQWFKSTETTYNSRGDQVSYSSYQPTQDGESLIEVAYTYDSKNRLVETVRSLNGSVVYTKKVCYSVHKDTKVIDGLKF